MVVLNVGLRKFQVFELTKNIDILFLQETHFYKISDTLYFNQVFEEKFLIFHSLAPCRNTGTTFLLSRNFSIKNVVKVFEIDGRCLAFKIFIGKYIFMVVGIYAPAKATQRPQFFDKLFEKIEETLSFSDVIILRFQ